jgi:hypothetical protein
MHGDDSNRTRNTEIPYPSVPRWHLQPSRLRACIESFDRGAVAPYRERRSLLLLGLVTLGRLY